MCVVYRARHRSTQQQVALKSIKLRAGSLLAAFRREAHVLSLLRHPGIVRIVDHGTTDDTPWYAMELVEGQPLAKSLEGLYPQGGGEAVNVGGSVRAGATAATDTVSGPSTLISWRDSLPLIRAICPTLSFLHRRGLIHRDLKPENILIKPDGRPVLVDFGLVVQFGGAENRDVLEHHEGGGTFAYMAPEQVLGRFVDARADLFSLGCVLYQCISGALPFDSTTLLNLAVRASPASAHNPEISPALDALVSRLLAKDPRDRLGYADDVESALAAIEGVESEGPKSRSVYLYRPDLAGRDATMPRLNAALENARAGESGVVLITGESGAGKTRLAMELAAIAAEKEMNVITGDCPPVGTGPEASESFGAPLRPLRRFLVASADAFRAGKLGGNRDATRDRLRLLAPYERAVSRALGDGAAEPEQLPAQAARARLYRALAGLIADYAVRKPLLLVLDDLQWADELTVDFLSWFAGAPEAARAPVLVVGTCRIEEMKEALRAFAAHPRVARETLVRFDRAAVKQMIGGMLALADPPVALVDFVAEESRGNPFFIAEYLRSSIEAGILRRDAAGRWRMAFAGEWADLREKVTAPPTIAAVVALRLKDVDHFALGVLAAAAVLGREFDVELVARTANCEASTVLSAYAVLSPRRILEEDGTGTSRFAHDKLREIAYAGIGAEARTELHRRAAAALEERYAGRDLTPHWGELGYHHAKAGTFALAADYYQRAGRAAQNAYANRDALRFLRLALEQLEGGRGKQTELTEAEVAVHEDIGDVLLVLGKPQEARASLERALFAANGQMPPVDKARRRRKIAQTWEREHRHVEALAAYALAEQALEKTPAADGEARGWWHEYVQIQVDKAWDLYFSAQVEELAALVERVRPAVIEHASPAQKTRFLQGLVQAASKRDRMRINDETLEHSRAQLEAATQCNDLRELANARFTRAFVLSMRGLQEESEPLFLAARDDARRLDDALLQARVEAYYAIVHRRLARQEEARAAAERLLAFTEERKMHDYVGVAHANLAWCDWRAGGGAGVEHHAGQALAAWGKLRPAYVYPFQWLARMPLAAYLHAKERTDESLENCRLMLEDPQQLLPEELAAAIERALSRPDAPTVAAVMEIARSFQFL